MDVSEKQAIEALTKKVDKLLFYLESDPTTNSKGLVESLGLLNNRVGVLEDDKKKLNAKVTVIASIGGFLFLVIKELWNKIVPNA